MPPPITTPAMGPPLDKTRWRVISVNRRPVPRDGDYSMQFADGRISGALGCNRLSASYTQDGAMLNVGAILATRMACPNMSWETEGSAVLARPVTIAVANFNDALAIVRTSDHVAAVHARGWKKGEKILRHAQVIVSTGPAT